ncbi:MAG: CPBP family intramembrane glutamic endopeptidase [Bacteroidota bacterium]
MTLRSIFYGKDDRIHVLWRILIFLSCLTLGITPLFLINNSILQFFGATLVLVSVLYLNARYLDKRKFSEYGLRFEKKTLIYLVVGSLIGAFTVVSLLVMGELFGMLAVSGVTVNPDLSIVFLFSLKMFLVAIVEEVFFRGYLFTNLNQGFQLGKFSNNTALALAVVLSSVFFGLAHFNNANASLLSIGFLTINGIVWCIPFIITKNLGLSIGLHAFWNFTQSQLGFTMSGNKANHSSVNIDNIGSDFWTGGEYGPEAGLLGVVGSIMMLLLTLLYLKLDQPVQQRV